MSSSTRLCVKCAGIIRTITRNRHFWKPGSLDQRLFRALTRPIVPVEPVSPVDRIARRREEMRELYEESPYRKFLVKSCREEMFASAEGRMMLIFMFTHHPTRDEMFQKNQLHKIGVRMFKPNPAIVQEAAVDTRWKPMADYLALTGSDNVYMIGDADPKICKKVLKIAKSAPFWFLLGGVIQHRLMNKDEVIAFSTSPPLNHLRSELVGLLESFPQQTSSIISHHQNELSICLQQHSERNKN